MPGRPPPLTAQPVAAAAPSGDVGEGEGELGALAVGQDAGEIDHLGEEVAVVLLLD